MGLTGTLGIDVTFVPEGSAIVAFTPARPVPADRLFIGLTPQEAAGRMQLLFPLCSNAHIAALSAAADMADGRPYRAGGIRGLLVAAEALREHSARILNDWAVMLGRQADVASLRRVNNAFRQMQAAAVSHPFSEVNSVPGQVLRSAATLAAYARQAVFPEGAASPGELIGASYAAGRSIAAAMVYRSGEGLEQFDEPRPEDETVHGRHGHDLRISGPGARRRVLARLVEVEALCGFLEGNSASPLEISVESTGGHAARASVDVARGRLVHEVEILGGKIADIRIGAPTAKNFSSGGAAETAIAALRTGDLSRFDWLVRLIVLEVDPCVAHDVRVQ